MIRSLYVLGFFLAFCGAGFLAPFVASLAYVWVDEAYPQKIAYLFMNSIHPAELTAILAFLMFFMKGLRGTRITLSSVLLMIFAVWCTLSTFFWAVAPEPALLKWDWAVKGLVMAAFLPLVFRTRLQIEAFIQVLLFSIMTNVIGPGLKTLVTGGGYNAALGFAAGNSGLEEGATLSATAISLIPLLLFALRNNTLLPQNRWVKLGYIGLIVLSISAAIGTYERTGLVAMMVVSIALWMQSRHKLLFGAGLLAAVVVLGAVTSVKWQERIHTITTYRENVSAYSRILVWEWTWNFVKTHPLGGGFESYLVNHLAGVAEAEISNDTSNDTSVERVNPKAPSVAFHSIYFEVLGEQGYVGLALYLSIIAVAYRNLLRIRRLKAPVPEDEIRWCRDLGKAVGASLTTMLISGAFIGIGFIPLVYYFVVATTCLGTYARSLMTATRKTARQLHGRPLPQFAVVGSDLKLP